MAINLLENILKRREYEIPEQLKKFNIDVYKDCDKKNLYELYKIVFPNYSTNKLIEWQNKSNPFGNSDEYTFLMKDGERIISQYAIVPKVFYIKRKECRSIMSLGTMTHPVYRGLGIFPYLAKIAYEYAKAKGNFFVYGFPNQLIYKLREIKLNWTILYKLKIFYKTLSPNSEIKINNKFTIQKIDIFSNNINDFFFNVKDSFPILIKKNKDYLNWRFVERPNFEYKKFLLFDIEKGKICSYFVLKRYVDERKKKIGHLVDFLIDPSNVKTEAEIFKSIEAYAVKDFKEDCKKISFLVPNENLQSLVLKDLSYDVFEMNNYFGFKIFNVDFTDLNLLKDQKNWYNTMGENDLF